MGQEHLLGELGAATCAVPYDVLGLHGRPDGPGLLLRVWQPDSEWIEVVDRRARRVLGRMERIGETDLFEMSFPRRRKAFPYLLRISSHGQVRELLDPYAFRSAISTDRPSDPVRLYNSLGAQLVTITGDAGRPADGVLFAVYAPSARAVSVVGFQRLGRGRHPDGAAEVGRVEGHPGPAP